MAASESQRTTPDRSSSPITPTPTSRQTQTSTSQDATLARQIAMAEMGFHDISQDEGDQLYEMESDDNFPGPFDNSAWAVTGDVVCSGGIGPLDEGRLPLVREDDETVCGGGLQEQITFQPFRVMRLRELGEAPFVDLFDDITCLDQLPSNLLITPLGVYRAILEFRQQEAEDDQAFLGAMLPRFGMVPAIIQDEDVVYAEDMEPCMIDEGGNPVDGRYWEVVHARREFWNEIPGGREYNSIE